MQDRQNLTRSCHLEECSYWCRDHQVYHYYIEIALILIPLSYLRR